MCSCSFDPFHRPCQMSATVFNNLDPIPSSRVVSFYHAGASIFDLHIAHQFRSQSFQNQATVLIALQWYRGSSPKGSKMHEMPNGSIIRLISQNQALPLGWLQAAVCQALPGQGHVLNPFRRGKLTGHSTIPGSSEAVPLAQMPFDLVCFFVDVWWFCIFEMGSI